jgi:hypothetical protein
MSAWRTNRRNGGKFRLRGLGRNSPFRYSKIPKETRQYMKVAKELGMKTRLETLPADYVLKGSRGFVEHEDIEGSEARKQYIREHLDSIPFIVVRRGNGRNVDIIDGNHRIVCFTEFGIARVPILRVSGSKEQLSKFEDFVQDYNKHPPWLKDAEFGKNPRTTRKTREKLRIMLSSNPRVSRERALEMYG